MKNFINIKGAVLDKQQLQNYIEKLATEHLLKYNSDAKTYPIPRVKENFKVINSTYNLLNNHIKLKFNIHPAGEWLLDNYYLIEEAIKTVEKELSKKKYKNFLSLANGQYEGFARIYCLASEIVAYTDCNINSDIVTDVLKSYQNKNSLSMDEIWSISIFLNIAIIENIRNVCDKIYICQMQKQKVEEIVNRYVGLTNQTSRSS